MLIIKTAKKCASRHFLSVPAGRTENAHQKTPLSGNPAFSL